FLPVVHAPPPEYWTRQRYILGGVGSSQSSSANISHLLRIRPPIRPPHLGHWVASGGIRALHRLSVQRYRRFLRPRAPAPAAARQAMTSGLVCPHAMEIRAPTKDPKIAPRMTEPPSPSRRAKTVRPALSGFPSSLAKRSGSWSTATFSFPPSSGRVKRS